MRRLRENGRCVMFSFHPPEFNHRLMGRLYSQGNTDEPSLGLSPLSRCVFAAMTKITSVCGSETAEILPTVTEAGKSKVKEMANVVS